MAKKLPVYREGGKSEGLSDLRPFTKGLTVTRNITKKDDQWWYDTDEVSWGDPDNGDGQHYTTIHHRQVVIKAGHMNPAGEYTQTAIVTRTDGDAEPVRVLLVTGLVTEIISYG